MRVKKQAKKSTKKVNRKPSSSSKPKLPSSLRSMENVMADFVHFLGGRGEERSPVDEAQEIMYDAWEAPTSKEAVALAQKALAISADCADAYNLLAETTAGSQEDAIVLYQKGVEAGERALGKRMFKENEGHFWGILETRPYMRALGGLAQHLWQAGRREESLNHFWQALRLNSNDNQGLRYILMSFLLESGRDADAEKLFRKFPDDAMAAWAYSRALLDFRKHGDSSQAAKSLKAAVKQNKHVPPYLLGRKRLLSKFPDYYGFGDDNEALLYVKENGAVWRYTLGALAWLEAGI